MAQRWVQAAAYHGAMADHRGGGRAHRPVSPLLLRGRGAASDAAGAAARVLRLVGSCLQCAHERAHAQAYFCQQGECTGTACLRLTKAESLLLWWLRLAPRHEVPKLTQTQA